MAMRELITNHMKDKLSQYKRKTMNIKDKVKTIIDDYSDAYYQASEYNKYNGFFKNQRTAESPWNYVKTPFLLKVKGLLASLKLVKEEI